jgi:hypothetical protein
MPRFAAQFLEYFNTKEHTPNSVQQKLRKAFSYLPLDYIIIGWDLPSDIIEACASETSRNRAQLYRWHPFLTGDGILHSKSEWSTINSEGKPIAGHNSLAEFTFICPNRPAVKEVVLTRLQEELNKGIYQGIFLDRIRYPSPTINPKQYLACFCDDCRRTAANEGLDLIALQKEIQDLNPRWIVERLFQQDHNKDDLLCQFLDFRERCISRIIEAAFNIVSEKNITIGLDCYSPTLTRMVGQNLSKLASVSHWIKPMIYAHALGPAGIPFELLNLAKWLSESGWSDLDTLKIISNASGLLLPTSFCDLREKGMLPQTLREEVELAVRSGILSLLAGIAIVELNNVNHVTSEQLINEIGAYRSGGSDGLVLSWDLWHIPEKRLGEVALAWGV